jgi:hypothetical protein
MYSIFYSILGIFGPDLSDETTEFVSYLFPPLFSPHFQETITVCGIIHLSAVTILKTFSFFLKQIHSPVAVL